MVNKVYNQIIKNNKQIQINKEKYRERELVRQRQIIKDHNKDKIRRSRICKDCHQVKCIYNGRDEDRCRFYYRFNALYLVEEKKERKRAITASSEEGKKHLERLHEEERKRKEVR